MAHPALVQLGSFVEHNRHKGRAREEIRQEYKGSSTKIESFKELQNIQLSRSQREEAGRDNSRRAHGGF